MTATELELEWLKVLIELKTLHEEMLEIRNACLSAASIAVPEERLREIIKR